MTRSNAVALGLGALSILLSVTALLLLSKRWMAFFMLAAIAWAFCLCGGMYRWQKYFFVQWLMLVFGLFLMAIAMAWGFIYRTPLVQQLGSGIAIVALVLLGIALGLFLNVEHPRLDR
jgi:hypothetical protein